MIKKMSVRSAVAAAFVAASATSHVAFAVYEFEPNHPITAAQRITIGSSGSAEVTGAIGVVSLEAAPIADVDFFAFEAHEGNVITLDIDGGIKAAGASTRSVDTIIGVFGPDFALKAKNDQAPDIDPGSVSRSDSRITNFRVEKGGTYYVGVSSFPRDFRDGGAVTNPTMLGSQSNGSYTLLISGVTPLVQQMNILIKPGSDEWAPINPKAKGNIPVALLSSAEFDARTVDLGSLTFGASGDERSFLRCGKEATDINGDERLDLMCHFDNQAAGFEPGDTEGIVKGKTVAGMRFEGRGLIKAPLPHRPDKDK